MEKQKNGFTLLEALLLIAAIAILVGIVFLAINPNKQLADTHNATRRTDVAAILNAIYTYSLDNNGAVPASIPSAEICAAEGHEICASNASSCSGKVDLSVLTAQGIYIKSLPTDPKNINSLGTGYDIVRTASNRIIVCAPQAEDGAHITATR